MHFSLYGSEASVNELLLTRKIYDFLWCNVYIPAAVNSGCFYLLSTRVVVKSINFQSSPKLWHEF